MNDDWVYGVGPSNARLMIIGESLGKNEEQQRKPFVGFSGELLTELLETAKINRQSCYITNVVKIRPPDNDLERLCEILNPHTGRYYVIEDFLPLLFNEIEALQPNLILALGSLACKILTGREGIKNWRGSILPLVNFHPDSDKQFERTIKVIPTIHPAALVERNYGRNSGEGMNSWKQKAHIQFDVFKVAHELEFPDFSSILKRDIQLVRDSYRLEQFFNMYKEFKKVYVDTEVYKAHLVCIGFAFTRYHAISIPLVDLQDNENHKGIALNELVEIWRVIDEKLKDPSLGKAGQNFKADKLYWLEKAGFEVNNFCDDGMFKIHTLSPELPKSLGFQTSIFTNQPFYKYEGREYNPKKDNIDILLRYNAMDCLVNCECVEEMDKEIDELGLREFYDKFVMGMSPIYEEIEKRGWLLDKQKKQELYDFYTTALKNEIDSERSLLSELGIESEKDGPKGPYNFDSPDQVSDLIYVKMRCPQRKDTSDETLTALMNNAVKDKRKKQVIECKLNERSLSKLRGVYVDFKEDPDGRARCTYNQVGTETGRTSTSIIKKPLRNGQWGVPFQTIPRPDEFGGRIREMFIPDKGKILIEFDQSQAEARLVALLAEDYELLRLFDVKEVGGTPCDVHKLTSSFVFNYTPRSGPDLLSTALNWVNIHNRECYCQSCVEIRRKYDFNFDFLNLVTDAERQVGKSTRHGCAYDLGEEGLSIKMKISVYRAKIAYQKVHEMSPKIKSGFQEGVQEALARNNKVLMTPFGRRREFFQKWGKELFREAYAHIPQSTIGDNTKRCMWNIKVKEKIDWIEILQEGHDSFAAQVPENRYQEAYQLVKPLFEESIDFSRCTIQREPITIPVDCKIGYSWGQLKKYKGD